MEGRLSHDDAFRVNMGYCAARSPERGVWCERLLGHEGWHAYAGTRAGEERVWTDAEMIAAFAAGETA